MGQEIENEWHYFFRCTKVEDDWHEDVELEKKNKILRKGI